MNNSMTFGGEPVIDKSIFGWLAQAQRRKLLEAFHEFTNTGGTVLDIGLTAGPANPAIVGLTELAGHSAPGLVTVHQTRPADAAKGKRRKASGSLKLPFADGQFDWVCTSGVIEYMGDSERQFNLVREMARVARRGVFVATPNRLHPVKFSAAPRAQMLRAQDLYRFASLLPGKPAYDVGHKRVFGIKSHFFLMVEKKPARN